MKKGANYMKDILGKLDSYQILTNLLPGVLFGLLQIGRAHV